MTYFYVPLIYCFLKPETNTLEEAILILVVKLRFLAEFGY